MALNVAAQANSLAGLGNVFTPRNVPDYRIGALEARQSDNRTVNLFIDALDYETEEYNYAASVVEACVSHTVYALQCTAGSNREAPSPSPRTQPSSESQAPSQRPPKESK
ncbi:hypothetical protein NUW58_g8744 [Xylaria curta]|uniref:Uncharacterized protein n=1 Tax=Xylaria curta TaxID=42375 RepID=A0ACC1N502_9PEZI|nr:hypothetical protein NUW58_g8744 [Xylaria curta]